MTSDLHVMTGRRAQINKLMRKRGIERADPFSIMNWIEWSAPIRFNWRLKSMGGHHSFQLSIEMNRSAHLIQLNRESNGCAPFISIVNWIERVDAVRINWQLNRMGGPIHFNCQLNWMGWRHSFHNCQLKWMGALHSFQLTMKTKRKNEQSINNQPAIECKRAVEVEDKWAIQLNRTRRRLSILNSIESNDGHQECPIVNWFESKGRVPATQTNALSDQSNVNQQSTGNRMRKRRRSESFIEWSNIDR